MRECETEDGEDDNYICITAFHPPKEQAFAPTNQEWRAVQCKRLRFSVLMIGSLRHRPHQSSLGIPDSVDTIVGDGNCLYRAPLQPKTCGTDVEILAAATLLQTPVVVHSAYRRWLTYKPLFALNDSRLESVSQSARNESLFKKPVLTL